MAKNKQAYGTTSPAISRVEISTAIDGTPTGRLIYTQTGSWGDVSRDIPEIGSKSEFFRDVEWKDGTGKSFKADLVLKRTQRETTGGGDAVTVILTYGLIEEADDFDKEDGRYTLELSPGTASILLHPRYLPVPENEKILAKALLDGKTRNEMVSPSWAENGKLTLTADQAGTTVPLGTVIDKVVHTDLGRELIQKISAGIREYRTFGATWKEWTYKSGLANALTGLAKIKNPPGPQPAIPGRNWLYSGATAEKTKSGSAWQIVKTWTLSDSDSTWDRELYG